MSARKKHENLPAGTLKLSRPEVENLLKPALRKGKFNTTLEIGL
jgi:hypothetical protein